MKKQSGFTIIEVSLVLGLAGLILLLAFIALPALWRSQRDQQRKDDVMTLADSIKKWQSNNNRGSLPRDDKDLAEVKSKYINKTFEDPDGTAYILKPSISCENTKLAVGAACTDMKEVKKEEFNSHNMWVFTSAGCSDNSAVKSSNARKAAIIYRLELGEDLYCFEL